MIQRYKIDIYEDWGDRYAYEAVPDAEGDFVRAEDALPYMVWQPIRKPSDVPRKVPVLLRGRLLRSFETLVIGDDYDEDYLRSLFAIHGYTHYALAPVFAKEENV